MKESARLARNTQRLTEMFAGQATATRKVLDRMEAQGFRPRIQDAWRSPADQLVAFQRGTSGVRFGFHNVTGSGGAKESLACDVLDDDHPLGPPSRYLLALTIAARAEGLDTGILWKLSPPLAAGVEAAIAEQGHRPAGADRLRPHAPPVRRPDDRPGQGRQAARRSPGPRLAVVSSTSAKRFHVVVRGETLSGIARKFGLTLARLLQLNPQKLANPNLILVGEKIRVA